MHSGLHHHRCRCQTLRNRMSKQIKIKAEAKVAEGYYHESISQNQHVFGRCCQTKTKEWIRHQQSVVQRGSSSEVNVAKYPYTHTPTTSSSWDTVEYVWLPKTKNSHLVSKPLTRLPTLCQKHSCISPCVWSCSRVEFCSTVVFEHRGQRSIN